MNELNLQERIKNKIPKQCLDYCIKRINVFCGQNSSTKDKEKALHEFGLKILELHQQDYFTEPLSKIYLNHTEEKERMKERNKDPGFTWIEQPDGSYTWSNRPPIDTNSPNYKHGKLIYPTPEELLAKYHNTKSKKL